MRESKFIEQNKEKWRRYEEGIHSEKLHADEMSNAFVELNEDLAYARTFYRNRAVRLFLNNLLTPVYTRIYKGKKWTWKNLAHFFTDEVPRMNHAAGRYMLVSLVTVILGFMIGYFSTGYDREFAEVILGNDYVNITEENIKKGDPLAIYKSDDANEMFIRIATNNLRVAAYFFLFGALFCVGAMYLLLSNGIMLGAFTWMFTSRGLTSEYILTVYQHGTLEILSMVVEGAAGIMLGAGILFPGSLSRIRSMQNAARKSIIMFLVCVPVIILAAFIESYLTRFTEIPVIWRSLIIITSLFVMLYYFVIYPNMRFRKSNKLEGNYDKLTPETELGLSPGKVIQNSSIVLLGFDFIKKHARMVILFSIISLLVMYNLAEWVSDNAIIQDVQFRFARWSGSLNGEGEFGENTSVQVSLLFFNIYASSYYFSSNVTWVLPLLSFISMAAIIFFVLKVHGGHLKAAGGSAVTTVYMILVAIWVSAVQTGINYVFDSGWWFAMLVFFPMNVAAATICCLNAPGVLINNYFKGLIMVLNALGRYLGMVIINSILYFVFMFGFLYFVAILLAISNQFHGFNFFSQGILKFFVWYNYFIIPVILFLTAYLSMVMATAIFEVQTGNFMRRKIDGIRFKNEVYGVETE